MAPSPAPTSQWHQVQASACRKLAAGLAFISQARGREKVWTQPSTAGQLTRFLCMALTWEEVSAAQQPSARLTSSCQCSCKSSLCLLSQLHGGYPLPHKDSGEEEAPSCQHGCRAGPSLPQLWNPLGELGPMWHESVTDQLRANNS